MYRYRITIGKDEEGRDVNEDVLAGTVDCEGGVLIFRLTKGSFDIIGVYKAYNKMMRVEKVPDANS
jgi:hypothetical protein